MNENPKNRVRRKNKSRTFSRRGKVRAKRDRETMGDKGWWVYGIRSAAVRLLGSTVPGVQPGTKVETITFQDIEAVVSAVDWHQFGERPLKEKLAQDLGWTKSCVQRHHDVIVKAGGQETVVPMKFGTIFKTRRNLEAMLKQYYAKFKTLLAQLNDREERGVKVYVDRAQFVEQLKKTDKELQQFEKRKAKTPEGMQWYLERKIDEGLQQKFESAMVTHLAQIVRALEKGAEKVVLNDLSSQELTGKAMVLHTACLIKKETAGIFQDNVKNLFENFTASGFAAEITGPWPPYSFAHIKVKVIH